MRNFERKGAVVQAHQINSNQHRVTTPFGTLYGDEGDWLIVEAPGVMYMVPDEYFKKMFTPKPD